MYNFKKYDGSIIKDVAYYIDDWLKNNPNGKIVVGTDSSETKKYTKYAIVIAMFYEGNKGAHLIYTTKKELNNNIPLFNRLWNEIIHTHNILEYLKEKLNIIAIPHIDINIDINAGSNIAYQSAIGFFKTQGYAVVSKPSSWVASCAADCKCKN